MRNNSGVRGGNLALIFYNTSSTLKSTVKVSDSVLGFGFAYMGGGLYAEFVERSEVEQALCQHSSSNHNLLVVENTQFIYNRAQYAGSAVYLNKKQSRASCSVGFIIFQNCTFQQNSVIKSGYGGTAFHSITLQ